MPFKNEEQKSSNTTKITEDCLYFWPERNEEPNSVLASEKKKEGILISDPCGAISVLLDPRMCPWWPLRGVPCLWGAC